MPSDLINSGLALLGGTPIRRHPWPKWPRADEETANLVLEVLNSGRWAISGMYNGSKLYERRFAEAFAKFHGVQFGVPTANGSSALTIGLEALGVGYGKEVLVPGITWVACASSVLRVGGIPVLVDITPENLCMSVEDARNSITSETSAIMLVHLNCSIADLDAFLQLSSETGIPLIEDCSQAHGAIWSGKRVGSYGLISVFSLQDSKVITCGEGGIVLTDDPHLYDLLQQYRADGRRYSSNPKVNLIELEEVGSIQGCNYCLSEIQSAIALDRLSHLDEENRLRRNNAAMLKKKLSELGGISPLKQLPNAEEITYYQICFRLDRDEFAGLDIFTICRALTEELGVLIEPVDRPLNNNILYQPSKLSCLSDSYRDNWKIDPKSYTLPNATKAAQECLTLPHRVLLGDSHDIEDVVLAFEKVKKYANNLQFATKH